MSNRYLRQVVVVRKDLSMPSGKLAAMVAHASMSFILDRLYVDSEDIITGRAPRKCPENVLLDLSPDQFRWLTELDPGLEDSGQVSMAKIVCQVDSEEGLLKVETDAKAHNLTCHRVIDSGHSHNKPGTFVCVAIGPHWLEELEPVTGKLKVYR